MREKQPVSCDTFAMQFSIKALSPETAKTRLHRARGLRAARSSRRAAHPVDRAARGALRNALVGDLPGKAGSTLLLRGLAGRGRRARAARRPGRAQGIRRERVPRRGARRRCGAAASSARRTPRSTSSTSRSARARSPGTCATRCSACARRSTASTSSRRRRRRTAPVARAGDACRLPSSRRLQAQPLCRGGRDRRRHGARAHARQPAGQHLHAGLPRR